MKRAKKSFRVLILLLPVNVLLLLYLSLTYYYSRTFSLNTWINGIYCTGRSVEEVNILLLEDSVLPEIIITDMDGNVESISLDNMDCRMDYTVRIRQYIGGQNPFSWVIRLFSAENATISPMILYDEEALTEKIEKLSVIQRGKKAGAPKVEIVKSEAGYVLEENLYEVPDVKEITRYLLQEIGEGHVQITLSEEYYEDRPLTDAMKETLALWEKVDDLQDCGIIYDMGDAQVAVDRAVVADWIALDEKGDFILDQDGNPVLQEDCFQSFIDSLAEEFDTYNVPREFLSTRGDVIEIAKGTYGNRLDREAETTYLEEAFYEKRKEVRIPVYDKEALYRGKDDIGDTYIEVDMTQQMMYYYADGELELETPVVTGNLKAGHGTPSRVCSVYLKQTDRVLRGPDYASPVKFWMPVYGNIGIHDASWRSNFGGEIYKTNGSHGCINTPYDAMKTLYEEVETGTPVIMFY